jgi:hypothetical protein
VTTTDGGVLELAAYPPGVAYVSPDVFMIDVLTNRSIHLVSADWSSSNLRLVLPTLQSACADRPVCLFRLEVGALGCPNPNPSPEAGGLGDPSVCFADVRAMRSPPELVPSGAGQLYHAVRYVEPCSSFEPPTSPVCSASVESARKCAFGLSPNCTGCPLGAHCPSPGPNPAASAPGLGSLRPHRHPD